MSQHFKVIFPRNPLNVFYTGQTVRGHVQLLSVDRTVSSIQIKIDGIAMTKLKENKAIKVYRDEFFNQKICVLGKFS